MIASIALLLGLMALPAIATPPPSGGPSQLLRFNASIPGISFSLPSHDLDATGRAKAIVWKRENFLYGPSIAGNVSFWPTGSLGNFTVQSDYTELQLTAIVPLLSSQSDEAAAAKALTDNGGIKTLADYDILYRGQWKASIPAGLDLGILSNYTSDLLFSMERLSVNPFTTRRLNPTDPLPFPVDDAISTNITGDTLQSLLQSGRLFYADHRDQATLQSTGRYAAACDAYFYIDGKSQKFLPLAIRTNVGNSLTYTPADSANDWLLAKMMFNLNDFWHSQWYHLAATHNVVEIVYEAAYRTLSDSHPVLALLNRLTLQLFSYRMIALARLINLGGPVDQLFAFTSSAAAKSISDLYNSGVASKFQSNYLYTDLKNRGLINSTIGPELKVFPYLDDASVIHTSLQNFMASFVDSYYTDSSTFDQDTELQAWISEAVPAQIKDFPTQMNRETLIDILTHVAFLGSAEHQTLNTNDISEASGSLPLTPFSLYQPIPTAKGVTDIIPFLPNVTQSVGQVALTAVFARPTFIDSSKALTQMFNDPILLARMNIKTAQAATKFQREMVEYSHVVSSRGFDGEGLCQGMPFIWKALDPESAPYYLTI